MRLSKKHHGVTGGHMPQPKSSLNGYEVAARAATASLQELTSVV